MTIPSLANSIALHRISTWDHCNRWNDLICVRLLCQRESLDGYDKSYTSVSYFAVTYEENPLCELFATPTYSKASWYGSSFEREMTTKPAESLPWQPFYAVQLNAHKSHFMYIHHQMYLCVLSFWHRLTNKRHEKLKSYSCNEVCANIHEYLDVLRPLNFDTIIGIISIEKSVKFTNDSSRAGKACHVTIAADDKAHETEQ